MSNEKIHYIKLMVLGLIISIILVIVNLLPLLQEF
jgi:hypothetical protein